MELTDILVAYLPAGILALILGILAWRNSRQTEAILKHYGREMDAERQDRRALVGSHQNDTKALQRVIENLASQTTTTQQLFAMRGAQEPVEMPPNGRDPELEDMIAMEKARVMAQETADHRGWPVGGNPETLAPADMSSAEYTGGD
ncbi:MAG: hypothetical protein GY937_20200 [bacterium]|nr:hypothetical protein [bacterium]